MTCRREMREGIPVWRLRASKPHRRKLGDLEMEVSDLCQGASRENSVCL